MPYSRRSWCRANAGLSDAMKVLIVHTLPAEAIPGGRGAGEFDLSEAAQNIASVLPDAVVAGVRGSATEMLDLLAVHRPDVVFNACEAPLGRPELEPNIAGLMELLGV